MTNKFLLVDDKAVLVMQIKEAGFRYSAYGFFTGKRPNAKNKTGA